MPESAPASARLVDAPLEESAGRLIAHIRELRPDVVITHDAHGGLTGHPDHRRTHQVVLQAVLAAHHAEFHPEAGPPWRVSRVLLATHPQSSRSMLSSLIEERKVVHTVSDEDVALALDVKPWLETKISAILAHHSEVVRGAVPALVAGLSREDQVRALGTEWYADVPGHPART